VVKPRLALYVGGMGARGRNFYNDIARRYGYEDAAKRIQDLFLGGKKDEAAAAVPDALVDEVALCGSPARIRDQLAEWKTSGVTAIMVSGDTTAVRTMAELAL
jgi:alkanesulfonate monooxygenase SsuD/methylene tetrahydromethanopterin reductase-like flavin-dependent oxidoreductase (luciferase family)